MKGSPAGAGGVPVLAQQQSHDRVVSTELLLQLRQPGDMSVL